MNAFKAFRIDQEGENQGRLQSLTLDDLAGGDVVIRVEYSSINYKDALAGTGKGKILRQFPLVGGVDAAGEVVSSESDRFAAGDKVIVTGYGLSQTHDGGYSEYLRVPHDWVVACPQGLTCREAMILGTAGFTAALARDRLENNGLQPGQGPVVVTGASGGVGSIAVNLFAQAGYEIVAVSGKPECKDWLLSLGASEVVDRHAIATDKRPMEKARWSAAVDNVGGETLADLVRCLQPWGSVASIGMAGGMKVETSVMPFILRGASILGITSAGCNEPLRSALWSRLADSWKPEQLDTILQKEVSLEELPQAFDAMLKGQTHGRTIVRVA